MIRKAAFTSLFLGVLLATGATANAAPNGAIIALEFQDSGERKVVMGASNQGMVFLGEDLGNFRAFRSSGAEGRPFVWVTDIDGDRKNEFVYAGDPSFVLDQGGDPYFGMLDGCNDFFLGNILDDSNYEVFCRNRNTLSAWFYDGQFLWEYSVTGRRITGCHAADVDGDEQLEFGCETSDGWLLVDLGNEETVQDVPDNPVQTSTSDPYEQYAADAQEIFSGGRTFDIDGDGQRDDKLMFSGGTLTLLDDSGATLGTTSIDESELFSAAVGDLNGDGTPEVFVGGVGKIHVISSTGDLLASVEARPGSLDRSGRVTVQAASANGLQDSTPETTAAAVASGLSTIERCYSRRMGRDQFVRVGTMFYELSVDGRGRVGNTQRIHSSVQNEELEECVENALEDLRFSGAAEGNGAVTIRLAFDFVDQ